MRTFHTSACIESISKSPLIITGIDNSPDTLKTAVRCFTEEID